VCGDLGYFDQCGATTPTPAPAPVVRTPIVTNKTVPREEPIQFNTVTKYDYREYPGYKVVKQTGSLGKRTITAQLTLTDGVETSRKDTGNSVTVQPIDQIVVVGKRAYATGKVYGISQGKGGWFSSSEDKYNIWGKYKPNKEVTLKSGSSVLGSTTTNSQGWFTFENIQLTGGKVWVEVFEEVNDSQKSITEKTKLGLESKTVTVEYDVLHNLYAVVKVTDGDTIKVQMPDGVKTVRLIGIDTPETVDPRKPVQCFGKEASEYMKKIALNKKVRLEKDPTQSDQDKYKQLLRYVYLTNGESINEKMISDGYAYEYTYDSNPYKFQAEYKASQSNASKNALGLWSPSTCSGIRP